MGFKEITVKMPTDYSQDRLKRKIEKVLRIKDFSWQIKKKSLDARNKNAICWQLSVMVSSKSLKGAVEQQTSVLDIPYRKRNKKVVVVGSGPAGFFCAFVLQKAGFITTILERGAELTKRSQDIKSFEETGEFNPISNYAFGEGGAGTFSDGKLTSRSKRISLEREFIISSYIKAGAPEEIQYMAHPHLGTDNLKKIVEVLRQQFLSLGGEVLFETCLEDLTITEGNISEVRTNNGVIEANTCIIASGHSAYDTYRMLIQRGVTFKTKNFALGSRVEHPQEIINQAQWGKKCLQGVKASEYRLTSKGDGVLPVYTFCMCPGGTIVPSAALSNTNIVNGMSNFNRDGKFANAACVAGINLESLLGKECPPLEALDWLQEYEEKFYTYSNGFKAPACSIQDFIEKKETNQEYETSYPLGLVQAPLWELLPAQVSNTITEGLKDFSRQIKGFDEGIIMGLESKTSAPIQVERDREGLCEGFKNLYMVGEGSGWAGGIISSAADGIKAALKIIDK